MSDVLPANVEAEADLLAAMLLSPSSIDTAIDILEPRGQIKFFKDAHALIYRAAVDMHAQGQHVDAVTLTDELQLRGQIEQIGGRAALFAIAALVPPTTATARYAQIVREMWTLRSIIRIGAEITRHGYERTGTGDEILAEVEQMFDEVRGDLDVARESTMSMYEAATYLDEKFRNPPEEGYGIPTPWSFLPSMHGGRLYVLGGYQADGKTVMGAHFFLHAVTAMVRSDYLTLEMSGPDLAERFAANAGIPAKRVQSGRLLPEQEAHAAKVISNFVRMGDTGMIVDAPAADIPMIRRLVKTRKPRLLVVDHLHQFTVRPEYERQDLEAIVRGLWQIAREFDIAILLLAQLSRTGDKKQPYPRPTMASLRGSAMIEALAWSVYFVWRERNEQNIATENAEWIVAKNRSGSTGIKKLMFHDRETRFTEIAYEG